MIKGIFQYSYTNLFRNLETFIDPFKQLFKLYSLLKGNWVLWKVQGLHTRHVDDLPHETSRMGSLKGSLKGSIGFLKGIYRV